MIYKEGFENNFFIGEECIESTSNKLISLINVYKFSIETISILSHIELNKLINFYNGKESLNYEEIIRLGIDVLDPLDIAIKTSIYNYNSYEKIKEARKKGTPIIFENYEKERENE